jgi:hypothetical protein
VICSLNTLESISDPFYSIKSAVKDKRPREEIRGLVNNSGELVKSPDLCYRLVKQLSAQEAEEVFPQLLPFRNLEPYLFKGLSKNPSVVPAFVTASLDAAPKNRTYVLRSLLKSGLEFSILELVDRVLNDDSPEFKAYLKDYRPQIIAYCVVRTIAVTCLCGAGFEDREIATASLALAKLYDALAKNWLKTRL